MSEEKNENRYPFQEIERKWQSRWEEADIFRVEADSERPKFYGLDFFPYPSGAGISVGHCRNYVPLDVACRQKVMQGYNVLHPMGWDAFGQPAENEAIKRGRNPRDMVPEYAANYKRQLKLAGICYDWSREINSSHPDYYRWTQWLFLLLFRRGLAYRANTPINWCPSCKTGLANEEVVNGRCWRCGTPVEKRPMPQWYFRITRYAERLLSGLDSIQWPEGIKTQQREWIGRSEGADVDFAVAGRPDLDPIRIFTTRPDTLWGATFLVLAPEHPLVDTLTAPENRTGVAIYREKAARATEIERQSVERAKTGVFTGAHAINPVNGEPVPIWIADYVLLGYGTGAIMAVPAHDQRDFEFARKFDIPIRLVYSDSEDQTVERMAAARPEGGVMVDTGPFTGLPNSKETVRQVIAWLEKQGHGSGRVNYRLRDWLISRQRYWGAPIPIVHCPRCGEIPVPEEQLPVLLPEVERYQPTGTGESPLAGIPGFVNTTCPACGEPARRETDTMGGFACSSWYFLRFADPHNSAQAFSSEEVARWLPVDLYVGGAEHAVMHLLYARFWTKVIFDAGLIGFEEPFQRLRNQGMLLAYTPGLKIGRDDTVPETGEENAAGDEAIEDWKPLRPEERSRAPEQDWEWRWVKMSKSMGNVVTPDEIAAKYGADSLRVYGLFVAPFEETVQWTDRGIDAAHRWIQRVWRLWTELRPHFRPDWRPAIAESPIGGTQGSTVRSLRRKLHQTIRKVTEDIENFRFNTCIAALMEFANELSAFRNELAAREPDTEERLLLSEILETLTLLLSPIAPHLADEFWERLQYTGFTFRQAWPVCDAEAAAEDRITIVVQINGKVRDRLQVSAGATEEEVRALALASDKIRAELEGKQVRKVIPVPGKLINLVVA